MLCCFYYYRDKHVLHTSIIAKKGNKLINTYVGTWIQYCLCKILHIPIEETASGPDKESFSIITLLLLFT